MPDWVKLAEAVTTRLSRVGVSSGRCCRVRSPLSHCSRCVEVCPTGGLAWADGELHLGRCLDCGLCTAVCPTGALYLQQPGEEELWEQLQAAVRQDGEAVVTCDRLAEGYRLSVPCLGALSVEFLRLAATSGLAVRFYLPPGACLECPVQRGEELLSQRLAELPALGGVSTVQQVARGGPRGRAPRSGRQEPATRREFFQELWSEFRRLPLAALAEVVGGEEAGPARLQALPLAVAPRKRLYLKALGPEVGPRADFYPALRVAGTCFFCHACSILCPAGALQQVEAGDEISLRLDARACTACGLCPEICFYGALEVDRSDALPQEAGLVLASGYRQTCSDCGQEFLASEETACCPTCTGKARLGAYAHAPALNPVLTDLLPVVHQPSLKRSAGRK